jgi:hypothetical protein
MFPELKNIVHILEGTPAVIESLMKACPEAMLTKNEGPETWSAFDIVGHLIHGEKTDWIARMEIILSDKEPKTFTPFDRFAQFKDSEGKDISQLLQEFSELRKKNIQVLKIKNLSETDLHRTGIHPAFGRVTLGELLNTWAIHDLNHINQITRVIANQYRDKVGPWTAYLPILKTHSQ